jgi:hypothetical protein
MFFCFFCSPRSSGRGYVRPDTGKWSATSHYCFACACSIERPHCSSASKLQPPGFIVRFKQDLVGRCFRRGRPGVATSARTQAFFSLVRAASSDRIAHLLLHTSRQGSLLGSSKIWSGGAFAGVARAWLRPPGPKHFFVCACSTERQHCPSASKLQPPGFIVRFKQNLVGLCSRRGRPGVVTSARTQALLFACACRATTLSICF